MQKDEIRFINELFKNLYYELLLEEDKKPNKSKKKKDRIALIEEYFKKQENLHDMIKDSSRMKEILKVLYHKRYIIDKDNIPEDYLNRIYLMIGNPDTDINLIAKKLIESQRASFDRWLDFLLDANEYKFWVRYWAFQSMIQIGRFDIKSGNYSRRTSNTVKPFIDFNEEALKKAMDLMIKRVKKEEIDDKELEKLVKNGSFAKLYMELLRRINNEEYLDGIWVKYGVDSDPNILINDVIDHNTNWCIARVGSLFAEMYLVDGDVYIYYTKDTSGEYREPRLAIRTYDKVISEIRGIAKYQNVEQGLEEVIALKLKEFSDYYDYDYYMNKVNDMKTLSYLYSKFKNKEELNLDDLKFLYEIDRKIDDFGEEDIDPRIKIIKSSRNQLDDFIKIVQSEPHLVINGNPSFYIIDQIKDIDLSGLVINGSLTLDGVEYASNLIFPEEVNDLYLPKVKSCKGIVLPKKVNYLEMPELVTSEGLILPKEAHKVIVLGLEEADGLVIPEGIGIDFKRLKTAKGIRFSKNTGTLIFDKLTDTNDLKLSGVTINGGLELLNINKNKNFKLSDVTIKGNLSLPSLSYSEDFDLNNISVGGYVGFSNYLHLYPKDMRKVRVRIIRFNGK